jgi:hypothetical protein
MATGWSREEVEAIVADYLAMLGAELEERAYSKTEHRRQLTRLLNHRSDGAIERKHQNISAVLLEFGIPYIDGYKPLKNYQRLLYDTIEDRLRHSPGLITTIERDVQQLVTVPTVQDILDAIVDPPVARRPSGPRHRSPWLAKAGLRTNYLELEARNAALGSAGEDFVVRYEIARLARAGCKDLASRVERVSSTAGDGLGFDVLSFESSGRDRLIEVKTTKYGPITPFFVTPNEVRVSETRAADYHLYRVFDFRKHPRLFLKRGPISAVFAITPSEYMVRMA